MVHPSLIEAQINKLGFKVSRWFSPEIRELEHILMDHEKIISLACGRYFGSFALLVATDQRLLLIDKRVFFMTIEDTRYDMISEIDYNSQVYNATVTVFTINKTHKFTTMKYKQQLRDLTSYVQRRVMEIRHQQTNAPGVPDLLQPQTTPAPLPRPQYQPSHSSVPQPLAYQPNDYYVDDNHDSGGRHLREHVGHVAHMVGSAATQAAHHSPTWAKRSANPYMQGSLMTRRPMMNRPAAPASPDY
jgi:hypothetical protein